MEQLEFIRNGGETRRFHTWPVLRSQTVAEHSFHVAMLAYLLAGQEEPGITVAILMAALTHDLAEERMGADMAAPQKRAMPDYVDEKGGRIPFRTLWGRMEQAHLREVELDFESMLSDREKRVLKLADAMEGALYCIRERAMGNQLIVPAYINFRRYIGEVVSAESSIENEILVYIEDSWEEVNGR